MIAEFDGKYAFLSNFYPSIFTHDGIEYPTVEHFFQKKKTKQVKGIYYICSSQYRRTVPESIDFMDWS